MSRTTERDRPPFIIFLDIDGVIYNTPDQDGVFKKTAELFPNEERPYNNRLCSIAASYFFNKEALQNLDYIINEMEKIAQVGIVISSSWRENRTVEDLKNTIFGIHNFARYIIDKTPESLPEKDIALYCPSERHLEKYSSRCRASQIQYWLKQYPEITNFAVLDDDEYHHLAECFAEKFFQTKVRSLLTQEIAENIVQQALSLESVKF